MAVVPENTTNSLLISSTARFYSKLIKVIEQLDEAPPQVVIQVLIVQVDLENNFEFGMEVGLQDSILFQRGIFPGTSTLTIPFTQPGVTINTNSPVTPGQPGFNFNTTAPLPNNNTTGSGIVGFQGLGNLGVGRATPGGTIGGFIFQASSDSFNLLIRALKTQGRLDVLSRPQLMTMDNQTAQVVVGQFVPFIAGATINQLGTTVPIINYRDVGVILSVTPKISHCRVRRATLMTASSNTMSVRAATLENLLATSHFKTATATLMASAIPKAVSQSANGFFRISTVLNHSIKDPWDKATFIHAHSPGP